MPSAEAHTAVVEEYLQKKTSAGRLIGPMPAVGLHISRFGVIPKGSTPRKWRLITDLSSSPGHSVNNRIDPERCSMSYITVDGVARTLASWGPGALMEKVDMEAAYWLIPVHSEDCQLLAGRWNGDIFMMGHSHLDFGRPQNI